MQEVFENIFLFFSAEQDRITQGIAIKNHAIKEATNLKRFSVFLVLTLAVLSVAALTSCGCQASTQTDSNNSSTKPDNSTGTPGSGSAVTPGTDSTDRNPNSSVVDPDTSVEDDFTDDPATDAPDMPADPVLPDDPGSSSDDDNSLGLPTYEDMLRNGRNLDDDGFLNDHRR